MLVQESDLKYSIGRVRELAEQYELYYIGADDRRRYVDPLTETCRTWLNTNIRLCRVDSLPGSAAVIGACVARADGFDILYSGSLNPCWTRFVICKELFHVILNDNKYKNMDLCGHVEEVTVKFPVDDSKPSPSVAVELLAEIAAMEFLFPYARRLQELEGPRKGNFLDIAEMYKVPRVYVERYLAKPYMEVLGTFCT